MQNSQKTDVVRQDELRELVDFEVADIVATGNEQGYSAREVLAALTASVAASSDAHQQDTAPADDPLVNPENTPDSGVLPEGTSAKIDLGGG
jgi:hypothetical protein